MNKLAWFVAALFCVAVALSMPDNRRFGAINIDFGNLLPPPPAEDSAADAREMQAVLEMQKTLTPERIDRIRVDADLSVYRVAGGIFSPNFTKTRFPLAGAFFDKVNKLTVMDIEQVKQRYKRPRPFQANKAVNTPPDIAAAAQSPAYPSEHATFGVETALFLSLMVPERKRDLIARGWEYGEQRIAIGVAYPSDCQGGQIVAAAMAALLLQDPEFNAEFDVAKAEIRNGLGLSQ